MQRVTIAQGFCLRIFTTTLKFMARPGHVFLMAQNHYFHYLAELFIEGNSNQ